DAGARVDEPHPSRFPIIVVPHRVAPVVPVDAGQRLALERHLLELAEMCAGHAHAAASSEPDDPSAPASTICASCRGWCCYNGGQYSAFLDEETIERFAGRHPDFVAAQIAEAYLTHVPDMHYEGSCIFHTSDGCQLPRGMRASICNAY